LELSAREQELLREQLGAVLGYVEKLKELEVSGVEPMAHAVRLVNVTRPDLVRTSIPQSEAVRNAPAQADGLFLVPKIIE
jgi:aspartyl-tRNA(Asn)/glutamyl-tRNA(Gln) amidotransferase subunit C